MITGAPWAAFATWQGTRWKKRGGGYEEAREQLASRLLDVLAEHLPRVRGYIATWELSTPLTTQHFSNHRHGEIYGLAHTPRRFEQRWLRPRTRLPGLWLTGQDVATCGVAGALIGCILCASAVLGRNLMGEITRQRGAHAGLSRETGAADAVGT